MAKKQFKAESKRLLDLMINSIYTHKEIFLREIISNASDACDKLCYQALTDDSVKLTRKDFKIDLSVNKDARTITVTDNGIGMDKEDLENNLGVIASSGSYKFKQEVGDDTKDTDVIGQFGVGFYSAFMVCDQVTVRTRKFGSDTAYQWQSSGADGYTVTECDKSDAGTEVIMHLKDDTEDEHYSEFLEEWKLRELIKKYSDYIRFPIRMAVTKTKKVASCMSDKPDEVPYVEMETLNSMVPIWQRKKADVKPEEYNEFYREKFHDFADPQRVITVSAEGAVTYKALLFIPGTTPFDFYTKEYEKGLQLYSSGVLIMDKCPDLLPEHFRFVRGVVDSPDLSLNISRELLQHDRQLKVIAGNLEKKIKSELAKMLKDEREAYETFWKNFGRQLKYGVVSEYGIHKDLLQDLLLFWSSKEKGYTTLAAYQDRMPEDQKFVYYACGEDPEKIAKLPQVERILDKGYEILYLTDEPDQFVIDALGAVDEVAFKSVDDADALPETDEEKAALEQKAEESKPVLDFLKETLGDAIKEARVSKILKSGAVCLTADGPVSLEMEKYMRKVDGDRAARAQRVLELNPDAAPFAAIKKAVDAGDKDTVAKYAKLLYGQALLLADLPLEDPAEYAQLVSSLMA